MYILLYSLLLLYTSTYPPSRGQLRIAEVALTALLLLLCLLSYRKVYFEVIL